MVLEKFHDAYQYRAKKKLVKQLHFVITVTRVGRIDERDRTVVATRVIPWGSKFPSPVEALGEYRDYLAHSGDSLHESDVPPQTRRLMEEIDSSTVPPDNTTMDASTSSSRGDEHAAVAGLTTRDKKLMELCSGLGRIFTRPPQEDYIDPQEEISEIEPPQFTTPLTKLELRKHRDLNQPCPDMYIMYASGSMSAASAVKPHQQQQLNPAPTLSWDGREFVLCRLTIQGTDGHTFTAKPSLFAEHTALVDSKYIYVYTVDVVDSENALVLAAEQQQQLRKAHRKQSGGSAGQEDEKKYVGTDGESESEGLAVTSTKRSRRAEKLAKKQQKEGDLAASVSTTTSSSIVESEAKKKEMETVNKIEREKRILLRQAIVGSSTTAASSSTGPFSGGRSGGQVHPMRSKIDFTPMPSQPGIMRVHVLGTIQCCVGIQRDATFVRAQWILPDGCVGEGSDENGGKKKKVEGVQQHGQQQQGGSATDVEQKMFMSQLAFASRFRNQYQAYETIHTFNLPFEAHCTMPVLSTTPLRLVIAVFSKTAGGDGHQTLEGYTVLSVAHNCGMHQSELLMWRPSPTDSEALRMIFIGGSPSLADLADVAIPKHVVGGVHSKCGMMTSSTGSIKLDYMVTQQIGMGQMANQILGGTGGSNSGVGTASAAAAIAPPTLSGATGGASRRHQPAL